MDFDPVDLALIRKLGGGGKLPFGETTTVKEVLAECHGIYTEGDDGNLFYLTKPCEFVDGEKYIVNWNGVEYVSAAMVMDGLGLLGNMSLMGMDDTGEPFFINTGDAHSYMGETVYGSAMPLDGSTTLTISIRQEVTTVQKMSGKYVEGMGYAESEVVELFEEQEIYVDGGYLLGSFVLVIGKQYTVEINDNVYHLECFDDGGFPAVGAPYGDWSNYQFQIYTQTNTGKSVFSVEASGTYKIRVVGEVETVHHMEAKYLPEFVVHFNVDFDKGEGFMIADKTYEEFLSAKNANCPIKAFASFGSDRNYYVPMTNTSFNHGTGAVFTSLVYSLNKLNMNMVFWNADTHEVTRKLFNISHVVQI